PFAPPHEALLEWCLMTIDSPDVLGPDLRPDIGRKLIEEPDDLLPSLCSLGGLGIMLIASQNEPVRELDKERTPFGLEPAIFEWVIQAARVGIGLYLHEEVRMRLEK